VGLAVFLAGRRSRFGKPVFPFWDHEKNLMFLPLKLLESAPMMGLVPQLAVGGWKVAIDRVEVNRALAKAIAFKAVNKHESACDWARQLIRLLECAEILKPEGQDA
jgi:hypothetical protein